MSEKRLLLMSEALETMVAPALVALLVLPHLIALCRLQTYREEGKGRVERVQKLVSGLKSSSAKQGSAYKHYTGKEEDQDSSREVDRVSGHITRCIVWREGPGRDQTT
jgi:hypothetical protein